MNQSQNEEIDLYVNRNYKQTVCNAMEHLIKFEFPNIKNLQVNDLPNGLINLSFDEGDYTKEEVEEKIKEYRTNNRFLTHGK